MNRSKQKNSIQYSNISQKRLNDSKKFQHQNGLSLFALFSKRRIIWIILFSTLGFSIFIILYKYIKTKNKNVTKKMLFEPEIKNNSLQQKEGSIYDVCIVGAGPSGSTCAYYLAKSNIRVIMIDKEKFPRDKVCGNQVNPQAQLILSEIGVLQELIDENMVKWVTNRGMVSPSGINFVAELKEKECLLTVQRYDMDFKLLKAAERLGVEIKTNFEVESATLNRIHTNKNIEDGIWTIIIRDKETNTHTTIRSKVLVCADGAKSHTANNLNGLTLDESPSSTIASHNGIGCRAFAKPYTHEFRADDVSFYARDILPGCFRISTELNDYLNLSCFSLPYGDVLAWHIPRYISTLFDRLTKSEPWINASLGSKRELSSIQTAPIRVGGIPKSYFPQGLIVGDAAGQQDPLTGDGLQYGMTSSKIAAEVIVNAFNKNNFSEAMFKRYDKKWKKAFQWDFFWSKQIAKLISKFPLLVDATALVIQRQGIKAIIFWVAARAGIKSKWEVILWFLRPDVSWLMCFYLINLWWKNTV